MKSEWDLYEMDMMKYYLYRKTGSPDDFYEFIQWAFRGKIPENWDEIRRIHGDKFLSYWTIKKSIEFLLDTWKANRDKNDSEC